MEKNSASCTKKKQCCGEEICKTVSNLEDVTFGKGSQFVRREKKFLPKETIISPLLSIRLIISPGTDTIVKATKNEKLERKLRFEIELAGRPAFSS